MATFSDLQSIAGAFPHVEESTSYNTPAFKIHKRLIARLREDGYSMAMRATEEDRMALPTLTPDIYSIPAHYVGSEMLVIDLHKADRDELQRMFAKAVALTEHDAQRAKSRRRR